MDMISKLARVMLLDSIEMNILFYAIVLSLYLELQFVLNFIAELF